MDRDFLIDLFSGFGPVSLRRMFSGYGVVADDVNFALVLRGAVLLKVDDVTRTRFEAEGSKPFQYDARGKTITVNSYWYLPERLYDEPEELALWAREAVEVAKRATVKKAVAKKKPAKPRASKARATSGSKKAVPRKGISSAARKAGRTKAARGKARQAT
jgi:DNA transformation protein